MDTTKLTQLVSTQYTKIIHFGVLAILLLISMFVSAATVGRNVPPNFFSDGVWLGFTVNLAFFYVLYALVFARKYNSLALKLIAGLVIAITAIAISVAIDVYRMTQLQQEVATKHYLYFTLVNSFVKVFFATCAAVSHAVISFIKQKQQYNAIKLNTLQTELDILKRQTNPHFLFNTLNALYSKAYLSKQNELAEHIGQLAALMQYTFTQSDKVLVKLEDEIDHIEAFIALQKLRIGDNATINFNYGPIAQYHQIPPMLLNPLIENACKYGLAGNPDDFVNIQMRIDDSQLTIEIENSNCSHTIKQSSAYQPSGTGLDNLQKRLNILFHDTYQLSICECDATYAVRLTIPCH